MRHRLMEPFGAELRRELAEDEADLLALRICAPLALAIILWGILTS